MGDGQVCIRESVIPIDFGESESEILMIFIAHRFKLSSLGMRIASEFEQHCIYAYTESME